MVIKSWMSTLRLPRARFPHRTPPELRASLLRGCTKQLYEWQNGSRPSGKQNDFVLNDGPPYANAELHVGHALNKILKDMILRVKLQQGRRVQYIPGWDCHGLPIELKALAAAEEGSHSTSLGEPGKSGEAGKPGKPHTQLHPAKVRELARELASKTVIDQMKSFQSYAVMGSWHKRWLTMDPGYVIKQLGLFQRMVGRGLIYRRHKPVYWSPSSGTALAEAELEYNENHASTAAWVKMEIATPKEGTVLAGLDAEKFYALIWTTTPWTLPANQAIAVHNYHSYSVVKVGNDAIIIGDHAREVLDEAFPDETPQVLSSSLLGKDLTGLSYINKLQGPDAKPQPIIHADFVTSDSGSGLVHLAPGHGFDDYNVCTPLDIPAVSAVDGAGMLSSETCPGLRALDLPPNGAALDVLKGGSKTIISLLPAEDVVKVHKHRHKYPYDWRTKQPIVIRAAAQWFADVDSIKARALAALDYVRFIPESGRTRLESFIRGRSEWCISRQRAWGVPIPAFYDADGNAFMDEAIIEHVVSVVKERGIDAWWADAEDEPAWVPKSLEGVEGLRRGTDTMDVWFDSGSSWWHTGGLIADVYIEGSDQHRGWFQSSLLTRAASLGKTRPAADVAPFKTLITHGFTLDGKGKKMSKSLGNVISPAQVMDGSLLPPVKRSKKKTDKAEPPRGDHPAAQPAEAATAAESGEPAEPEGPQYDALGADALRLWAASGDYTKDVSMAPKSLASIHSILIRYRTILRMLLGSISASGHKMPLDVADRIALIHLKDTMREVGRHYDNYEFYKGFAVLNHWISQHLSAFYLEVRKDRLYCGDGGGVLLPILDGLLRMLAPLTPVLVEEAWHFAPSSMKAGKTHPHRKLYNEPLDVYAKEQDASSASIAAINDDDDADATALRAALPVLDVIRAAVNAAAEEARKARKIGASLQCAVTLKTDDPTVLAALNGVLGGPDELATLLVVSDVKVVDMSSSPMESMEEEEKGGKKAAVEGEAGDEVIAAKVEEVEGGEEDGGRPSWVYTAVGEVATPAPAPASAPAPAVGQGEEQDQGHGQGQRENTTATSVTEGDGEGEGEAQTTSSQASTTPTPPETQKIFVEVRHPTEHKCPRCWRYVAPAPSPKAVVLEEAEGEAEGEAEPKTKANVQQEDQDVPLCQRCDHVVNGMEKAAQAKAARQKEDRKKADGKKPSLRIIKVKMPPDPVRKGEEGEEKTSQQQAAKADTETDLIHKVEQGVIRRYYYHANDTPAHLPAEGEATVRRATRPLMRMAPIMPDDQPLGLQRPLIRHMTRPLVRAVPTTDLNKQIEEQLAAAAAASKDGDGASSGNGNGTGKEELWTARVRRSRELSLRAHEKALLLQPTSLSGPGRRQSDGWTSSGSSAERDRDWFSERRNELFQRRQEQQEEQLSASGRAYDWESGRDKQLQLQQQEKQEDQLSSLEAGEGGEDGGDDWSDELLNQLRQQSSSSRGLSSSGRRGGIGKSSLLRNGTGHQGQGQVQGQGAKVNSSKDFWQVVG